MIIKLFIFDMYIDKNCMIIIFCNAVIIRPLKVLTTVTIIHDANRIRGLSWTLIRTGGYTGLQRWLKDDNPLLGRMSSKLSYRIGSGNLLGLVSDLYLIHLQTGVDQAYETSPDYIGRLGQGESYLALVVIQVHV